MQTCAYERMVIIDEGNIAGKIFFPKEWEPEDVVKHTIEALQNVYEVAKQKQGRFRFRGMAKGKMIIQVITEADGTVVMSHPIIYNKETDE